MADIVQRLQAVESTIRKLLEVSTAAGASIGVLNHGEVIFTRNYGYRDIQNKIAADEHTVYHCASLTKSFTATAVSMAVQEGLSDWHQPLTEILPDFTQDNKEVAKNATVLDLLSHRTGLASKNSLWLQDGTELLLEKRHLLPVFSYLETLHPFRSQFLYNNFGYSLASVALEAVKNKSWGQILHDDIIQPLGLSRTFTRPEATLENAAVGYIATSHGNLVAVDDPTPADGTIMQGAAGVRSGVHDLLMYYKALLHASENLQDLEKTSTTSQEPPTLGDVRQMFSPQMEINSENEQARSYGAGWVLAQLPAALGAIGTNGMYLSKMPLVGKGAISTKIWYHNGSMPGFFSSVHILPDTATAIVVLVNTLAKNDCADWIGQLLVETVLSNADKNNYVALAEESAASYDAMWAQIEEKKEVPASSLSPARPLSDYVGKFNNKPGVWYIETMIEGEGLAFRFQGRESQKHRLRYRCDHSFSWYLSAEESAKLGRWPDLDPAVYVFHFEEGDDGRICGIRWRHDFDISEGELLFSIMSS